MRKSFLFALALTVSALAFVSCDNKDNNTPNDPKEQKNPDTPDQPIIPASEYDGIWVSDSILNEGGVKGNGAIYVEVLNAQQVRFHGGFEATYEIFNEHFFTLTFPDSIRIHGEIMFGEDEWVCVDIWSEEEAKLDHIGLWNGESWARLFMYHLPAPEGDKLPVNEANILGKWRTTYEINASYNSEGKLDDETKFYHDYQIWDIQANGIATAYSDPYSYEGWWALDGDKLALYTGKKPADMNPDYFRQVELYSNFMHIIHYTYREDGVTLYSSNQQFLYRVK